MITFLTLLADDPEPSIWGTINPGPGSSLGQVFTVLLKVGFIIALISLMIFAFMGALDWIGSGDSKENLDKARRKITNAFIGMLALIVVIVAWIILTSNMLGIVNMRNGLFEILIPSLKEKTTEIPPSGRECYTRGGIRCAPGTPDCVCLR